MDDGLDPRFDPQYQRGFDPGRHGTPAPRYHLALLVLAIAFGAATVALIVAYLQLGTGISFGVDENRLLWLNAVFALLPAAVAGAVISLVVWLFVRVIAPGAPGE